MKVRNYEDIRDAVCCIFLGALAKLQMATIGCIMSVRPSAWNNSAPAGRISTKFDI
jgi:hypothetical protein